MKGNFARIPHFVSRDPSISLPARGLFTIIRSYKYKGNPKCNVSINTLMENTGYSKNGVLKLLHELIDGGFVIRKKIGRNNYYYFPEEKDMIKGAPQWTNKESIGTQESIDRSTPVDLDRSTPVVPNKNILKKNIKKNKEPINMFPPSPLCSLILESEELQRRGIVPDQERLERSIIGWLKFTTESVIESKLWAALSWLADNPRKGPKKDFIGFFGRWLRRKEFDSKKNGNGIQYDENDRPIVVAAVNGSDLI